MDNLDNIIYFISMSLYNTIHDNLIIDIYSGKYNDNNKLGKIQLNNHIHYLTAIAKGKDKYRYLVTKINQNICLFKALLDIKAYEQIEYILDNGFKDLSFVDLDKIFSIPGPIGKKIIFKYGKMINNYYNVMSTNSSLKTSINKHIPQEKLIRRQRRMEQISEMTKDSYDIMEQSRIKKKGRY